MAKIDRRSFLTQASKATIPAEPGKDPRFEYKDPSNKTLPTYLGKSGSGIDPYTGTWTESHIKHLLKRTMFGFSKADLDFFKTKTMDQAVDFLLNVPLTPPDPPLNYYGNMPNQNDPDVPYGQTWVNAAVNPLIEGVRRTSLKAWWFGLMLNQERNIREKMTLFWHNHFATESNTVQDARYLYKHHAMLRANCLGNFKDMVREVTMDPSMLVYLNGEVNTEAAPDENYGRELQELFTVGKDLPSHYTEDDVKAAARVLTGWRNNRTSIASYFDYTKHDTGNKQFSSFYNNTVITGASGPSAGINELNALLDMIFAQDEVAKFICRKFYRYFVYYVIDATVENNVIAPLASAFRSSGYDIKVLLSILLKSEHFYDPLSMGCVIKQPLDFFTGASRQMNLAYPDAAADVAQRYNHWIYVYYFASLCGQDLGDPPNVAGWPAFYEDPQFYELWINSDSLPKRNIFSDSMVYVGYQKSGFKLMYDCIAFADQFSNPSDPNALVSDIVSFFYTSDLSQTAKDEIKIAFLLSGQSADHYWSDAWNTYKATPTDMVAKNTVNTRLQGMMKYIFGLAEFQLC